MVEEDPSPALRASAQSPSEEPRVRGAGGGFCMGVFIGLRQGDLG